MSGIREWSSVIVLAALAAGILQYLMPSGSMEKVTRLVIGAFVICSILVPIGKLAKQADVQAFAQENSALPNVQYQDTVNKQTVDAAQASVRTVVLATLTEKGIPCKNVALSMDTNEDGRISITKVFVSLDQKDLGRIQETKKLLEQELGLTTEVTADGS
ncbi:MAG: stage III sporulation protein AF [Clostridium sp.]|uniref:stage III sporulation protein AF n=1 Tax=Clostridium sp. TaxID=1506 RepID=UPI00290E7B49|nr:stage III sporulation protein AF [Clostridium sp.]MDU7337469.1 stage III sporulation protein AF [Clostridium sp.]